MKFSWFLHYKYFQQDTLTTELTTSQMLKFRTRQTDTNVDVDVDVKG
jgi:hypothetical protein